MREDLRMRREHEAQAGGYDGYDAVDEDEDEAEAEAELLSEEREREEKRREKKRERNAAKSKTKKKKTKMRHALAANLCLDVPSFDNADWGEGGDVFGEKNKEKETKVGRMMSLTNRAKAKAKAKESINLVNISRADRSSSASKQQPSAKVQKEKEKEKGKRDRIVGDRDMEGRSEKEEEEEEDREGATTTSSENRNGQNGAAHPSSSSSSSKLLDKMKHRMQGAHFRWLNEKLYTCSGKEAFEMMQQDTNMFDNYHTGFQNQTANWPVKPVDVAIHFVKNYGKKRIRNRNNPGELETLQVADFGCGDADLAIHFSTKKKEKKKRGKKINRGEGDRDGDREGLNVKVHSFDLVSKSPLVTACNMARVPLESGTCDIAVFCLALMGMDYPLFLKEAARTLKRNGTLWIAEVRSRFSKVKGGDSKKSDFISCISTLLDFKLTHHDNSNKMFVTYVFERKGSGPQQSQQSQQSQAQYIAQWPKLSSCMYKKR